MNKLLISLVILSTTLCQARTTLEQIVNNKPIIDLEYAINLANSIDRLSNKHKVPANVLAAIAMVESSYVLDAVNSKSNDYGLFQINSFNIKAYKFDTNKLLTDLDYSINAGAVVFKWFYKRYELSEAIRRYNCGTKKSCINWKVARKYLSKVQQYM